MKKVAICSYSYTDEPHEYSPLEGLAAQWHWSRCKQIANHFRDVTLDEGYQLVHIDNNLSVSEKIDLINTCDIFLDNFDKDRVVIAEEVFNSCKFDPNKTVIFIKENTVNDRADYQQQFTWWNTKIADLEFEKKELEELGYFGEITDRKIDETLIGWKVIKHNIIGDKHRSRTVFNSITELTQSPFLCSVVMIEHLLMECPINSLAASVKFNELCEVPVSQGDDFEISCLPHEVISFIKECIQKESEKKVVTEYIQSIRKQ